MVRFIKFFDIIRLNKEVKTAKKAEKWRDTKKYLDSKNKVKGIGGWLLFFIITIFVGLLTNIYVIAYVIESINLLTMPIYSILANVIMFLLGLSSAILLISKNKLAIKITNIFLWIVLILSFTNILFVGNADAIIPAIVYTTTWASYLRKSVRVKNTYNLK